MEGKYYRDSFFGVLLESKPVEVPKFGGSLVISMYIIYKRLFEGVDYAAILSYLKSKPFGLLASNIAIF